jgi:glycosyltransferase involved in cell wall biosynthesis
MKDKPLVSVITTFLNGERFIREAIESVFAQTYTNWELILVDDGSTDKSTGIALEYVNDNPGKVFYLEHPEHVNKGISASRNLGIGSSRGKYIATIDADDKWIEYKLEEQVEILETFKEAGMVYGASKYWYSWSGKEEDRNRDSILDLDVRLNFLHNPPALLRLLIDNLMTPASMSNILLRREVYDRVGGFEEKFPGMFEDQAFLSKVYSTTPVFIADRCWDLYRIHKDSCCSVASDTGKTNSSETYFLNWLEQYMSSNGTADPGIERALRRRVWRSRHPSSARLLDENRKYVSRLRSGVRSFALKMLPGSIRHTILSKLRGQVYKPPVGWVHFGELRRLKPIGEAWGSDRGDPIDRYYIEKFLAGNRQDIKGRVLEIGDDYYTKKYGDDRVTEIDILNIEKGVNPHTTIVADLSNAPHIPSDSFDCIIFTQTLHLIYDIKSTIDTIYRILKPGGVLLSTVAGISQSSDASPWERNWCWGFTSYSARKAFENSEADSIDVEGYGNVLVATSFLYGLAIEDLKKEELEYYDHNYEVVVSIRAVKTAKGGKS